MKTNAHRSVVGMMVGPVADASTARFDVAHLGAILPLNLPLKQACFAATTSDGVYAATGLLSVQTGPSPLSPKPAGFVPIKQPTWKYAQQLQGYGIGQFSGLLVSGQPDCGGRRSDSAVLHPLSLGQDIQVLQVAIASHGAKVSARLEPLTPAGSAGAATASTGRSSEGPAALIQGECRTLTGRTTAFDTQCLFPIETRLVASRDLTLLLRLLPRSAPPRTEKYTVRIAP